MTNIEKFFAKLDREMELVYHDPHKWLHNIEIEDIPETIEELEVDIFNLEHSINEYDGDPGLFYEFEKRVSESITYKRECIEILQNIWNDNEEGIDNE